MFSTEAFWLLLKASQKNSFVLNSPVSGSNSIPSISENEGSLSVKIDGKISLERGKLLKKGYNVLINNAGFGIFGRFNEIDIDKELNMIDLNIKSYVTMIDYSIPYMKKNSKELFEKCGEYLSESGILL